MLSIDEIFPEFNLTAVIDKSASNPFGNVSNADIDGKWSCFFFWPMDFTFVCPTEIAEFGKKEEEFKKLNCNVYGCSTDSEYSHLAWMEQNKMLRENVKFPLLSDLTKDFCYALGILTENGVANRVTYLVNPEGIIKFASATDGKVGRNVDEVLRVLSALQSDKLCPCGWQPGDKTLN